MKRYTAAEAPLGFVEWKTEYHGKFGEPWCAWLAEQEKQGWALQFAEVKGRRPKTWARVIFQRPATSNDRRPVVTSQVTPGGEK